MPHRILRSWIDSRKFDGISWQAEVLFNRLIMVADDYGRFNAEARLVMCSCLPLRRDVTEPDVVQWISEMAKRNLIELYDVPNRGKFLAIVNFRQRLRGSIPKFPGRPNAPDDWMPDDSLSGELRLTAAGRGDSPPYSESYSETKSKSKSIPTGGNSGKPEVAPESPHNAFIRLWCETYRQVKERKYPFAGGKDASAVKRLLGMGYPVESLMATAVQAWKAPQDRGHFSCNTASLTIAGFTARLAQIMDELKNGTTGVLKQNVRNAEIGVDERAAAAKYGAAAKVAAGHKKPV